MKSNLTKRGYGPFWPILIILTSLCFGHGACVPIFADDITTDDIVTDDQPEQKPATFDYREAVDDIRVDELQSHLGWLAAPEQEGRNSGTEAGHRAGDYLVTQLALLGIEPAGTDGGYIQGFRFRNGEPRYRNVLGVLRGGDPELADEYVMICAHYDHIGVIGGRIHPGANDNASGTSMILELAESLQKLEPRPKRSVVVAFWDAEEKGLLGSMHFADNPTLPLDKIKIVFNFDMVGTLQDDTFEIFGSNVATGTREFISRLLVENDPDVDFSTEYLLASDHASLYAKKVPALMFFTGLNCPYHVPEDSYDIISFEGMKRIADIAFRVVFQLADADDLDFVRYVSPREMRRDNNVAGQSQVFRVADAMGLTFEDSDGSEENMSQMPGQRSFGKMFGRILGGNALKRTNGIRVTKVAKDSTAERLGIQRGDRVMTFNGRDVTDDFDEKMFAAVGEEPDDTLYLRVSRPRESKEWLRVAITPDDLPEVNRIVRQGFLYRESVAEPDTLIVSTVFSEKAAEAGLRPDDRVMHVNGERASAETLREALTTKRPLLLEIERNGKISELKLAP